MYVKVVMENRLYAIKTKKHISRLFGGYDEKGK